MAAVKAEIIEAAIKQTSTVIFLHGLGDNGSGWASIFKQIVPKHCKIICPHANPMPVSLNGGMQMPSWFDIFDLSPAAKQDVDGIKKASKDLESLVSGEIAKGIPSERIVIGGFSQGGAVALYLALTGPFHKLGGVLALSTWLPMHKQFQENPAMVKLNKSVPVLQCHGEADPLVPLQMGSLTSQFVKMFGMSEYSFKTYSKMGHSSDDREIGDIQKFLGKSLPNA